MKILLLSFLFLISCSKNDNPDTPSTENLNCKISKITYGGLNNRTYTPSYNGDKLIELNSLSEKVVFSYNSNGYLIKREYYKAGDPNIQFKTEYTPNNNGIIIERKDWEYYNGNLTYTGKTTFTYNNNKLTEIKDYNVDDVTVMNRKTLEWTNEKPTKLKIYRTDNTLECENNISYDLTKENKFNSTFKYFMFQIFMMRIFKLIYS